MSPYNCSPIQIFQHMNTGMATLRLLITAARPQEWVKNVLVFSALLFSKNVLNPTLLLQVVLAFGLYCLSAGQQFPLMACESSVTMAADSTLSVSTIRFRLLKRLS